VAGGPRFTADDYRQTMDLVASAAQLLLLIGDRLDKAQETVRHAGTLGPILEPTLYGRGGAKNLDDGELILTAAIALRDVARKVADSAR
jgi:hypothetical protein